LAYEGNLSVIASGENVFNPSNKQYELEFDSYLNGMISVKNGKDFLSNFTLYNPGYENAPNLEINGNDLVMKFNLIYAVSSNGLSFAITKGNEGQFGTIQEAIDFIKTEANGDDCSIQFGDGTAELDISIEYVTFDSGNSGMDWGKITISGRITSAIADRSGTIYLRNGVSVESGANIKNTAGNHGYAIYNDGIVTITGGTISTSNGSYNYAIYNYGTVTITGGTISASDNYAISSYGSVILGGNPDITGRIRMFTEKLSVIASGDNVFNPGNKQYELEFDSYLNGIVAVKDGKDFLSNFTLYNPRYENAPDLEINGNDLVIKVSLVYSVSSNGLSFIITNGNQFETIRETIDFIKTSANGADCSIQFGDGTEELDINGESITFGSIGWGKITLLGKITSAVTEFSSTISLNGGALESKADIRATSGYSAISNQGTLTITGGMVSASAWAISNLGTLTITGGTISGSSAISNSGTVTIIGGTISTSGNAISNYGTVTITGGTISGSSAISNSGTVTIIGGTISSNYVAIYNDNANGSLILGGSPDITGRIRMFTEKLRVIASGGDVFNPDNKQYELEFDSYLNGMIAVKDAKDFFSNFVLYNPGYENVPSMEVKGNDLVMKISLVYSVSLDGLSFTITRGNQFSYIQEAINYIKAFANGENCSIQFGDGVEELDIGTERITFDGGISSRIDWGKITLSGKITSATNQAAIFLGNGVSVDSEADIKNTASNDGINSAISNYGILTIVGGTISTTKYTINTISNYGTITITGGMISGSSAISNYGTVTVTGGTISATSSSGTAIYNDNANGSVILGSSPDITGRIRMFTEKLSVIASGSYVFNPGNRQYELEFGSYSNGILAVKDGKDFPLNFTLSNLGWGLVVNGNDLVTMELLYTVTFVDWNGMVMKAETVNHGFAATAPTLPTKEGYKSGWDKAFNNVTSDLTVTAQYTINTYTVTFVDWNGTILKTQVNHSSSATAPITPAREGYIFTGWDVDYSNVTSDLTVTAMYKENTPIHNPTAKTTFAILQTGESIQIVGTSQATPISIYNLQGKVFMTRTAMPNESISVAHLPKGVYVVKVSFGSEKKMLRVAVK